MFPWFFEFNEWCPVFTQIAIWLAVLLLSTERGLRNRSRGVPSLGWWALGGLALSQAIVSWAGQGSFFVAVVFGLFLAWRPLFSPDDRDRRWMLRIGDALAAGGAISVLALLIGAAGILPRLEANAISTVAGGTIENLSFSRGGVKIRFVLANLVGGQPRMPSYFIGGAVLGLALLTPLVARRWRFLPYFGIAAVAVLLLSLPGRTFLHEALYLVPGFETFQGHVPIRFMTVGYLMFAMLAGATADGLFRWRPSPMVAIAAGALPAAAGVIYSAWAGPLYQATPATLATLTAVGALVLIGLLLPRAARPLMYGVLMLVIFWTPAGLTLLRMDPPPMVEHSPVGLEAFAAATGPAGYLAALPPGTARFAGYAPNRLDNNGIAISYRKDIEYAYTSGILVNNRGILLGLDDAQGYYPSQPLRYAQLVNAMNGQPQEYHELKVLASGLGSPILDLMSVRFLLIEPDEPGIPGFPEVYSDGEARILENPEALPRVRLVHDVEVMTGEAALSALASGAVNPRETALVEQPVAGLLPATGPETVEIAAWEPDRLALRTRTTAPALLVLAESYDPGWKATVNGQTAEVLVVDHAFRGVVVPAGDADVVLWFDSPALRIGLWISLLTAAGLLGSAAWRSWSPQFTHGRA
jgi:hypothetical protein